MIDESALRITIDHLLEGVQVVGFDWTYLYLNQTAARHGRREVSELVGRTMMACYPGIEQTELFAVLERVMRTRRSDRMLNEFAYADGEHRWFELLIDPVPDGLCVLSLDVTERQRTEVQLQQAQKMEAIGQLAGGVAHDFNNMLTAILGYAELLSAQIGPDKPIGRDIQEIVSAGERAASLTRQLLAFSRKQTIHPIPTSLAAVVTGVQPMLRRLIGENVVIRTSLDPATYPVLADPVQLQQVMLNLAVNARDAMVNGGTLTIATHNASLDDDVRDDLDAAEGDYAVLSVTDTGIGMTPEVQQRIFEPFYTTKQQGQGTGLGLAAVHGIVKQLGGTIWVYSEPGHGSVFKIYLPKTDQAVEQLERRARTGAAVGRERILLVEDEGTVRTFARRVLERHGYQVWDVGTGEAALAWVAEGGDALDLLITDVMLPGMDGVKLANHLLHERDALRVLFISGYAEPTVPALPSNVNLLDKPFTAHGLLSRVREALDLRTNA